MAITTNPLPNLNLNSDQDIVDYTTEIIKSFEGFVPFIYDDGNGVPTLGYGIALVVGNPGVPGSWSVRPQVQLNDIFDSIGHQLSIADIALLQQATDHLNGIIDPATGNVVTNPFNQVNPSAPNPADNVTSWTIATNDGERMIKNILSSDPSRPVTQAIDLINGNPGIRNQLGQVNGAYLWDSFKDSREGAALLSLWYNGQSEVIPQNSRLRQALANGDRAAAWYEIRYQSNGGASASGGIAKRRYLEAALFGLYNDPTNVTDDEAAQVLDMFLGHTNASGFSSNRRQMWAYDTQYLPRIKGSEYLKSHN